MIFLSGGVPFGGAIMMVYALFGIGLITLFVVAFGAYLIFADFPKNAQSDGETTQLTGGKR